MSPSLLCYCWEHRQGKLGERKKYVRVWDSVLPLVCSFCSNVCITKKGQANQKKWHFFSWGTFLIYSALLSLRLIVELSSSPSTLLALSLAKMIAISCIPSAASCTQRDCLGWPRQMIMNKSELLLITTP